MRRILAGEYSGRIMLSGLTEPWWVTRDKNKPDLSSSGQVIGGTGSVFTGRDDRVSCWVWTCPWLERMWSRKWTVYCCVSRCAGQWNPIVSLSRLRSWRLHFVLFVQHILVFVRFHQVAATFEKSQSNSREVANSARSNVRTQGSLYSDGSVVSFDLFAPSTVYFKSHLNPVL